MAREKAQQPPALHDLSAERAVLGALFMDAEAWRAVSDTFDPAAFHPSHAAIARAISARYRRGDPVDPILIRGALSDAGFLESSDLVLSIAHAEGSLRNAGPYWQRVRTLAERRETGAPADTNGVRDTIRNSLARFTTEQLLSEPPAQQFILKPYLPAGKVATLAGPGGSNKTTLTTYLAVCRALEHPFYGGATPSKGKTAIITTEDGKRDYWRRLAALREDLGDAFDAKAIAENVFVFDLAGERVRFIEAEGGGMFRISDFIDHFAAVLKEELAGVDLIIVETVSRVAGGIETNESLSVLVSAAERLAKLTGSAILLISHVGQEAGRNGYADAYAPRGGSALGDNGRSTMVLTAIHEKNRKEFVPSDADASGDELEDLLVLTNPKSNGARCAEPLILKRRTTPHGPVLGPHRFRYIQQKSEDLRSQIVARIGELAAEGKEVSRRSFGDTWRHGICSKRVALDLIGQAVAAGELVEIPPPSGGRGFVLVPGRGSALVPGRDPGATSSAAPKNGAPPPAELWSTGAPTEAPPPKE